MPSALQRSPRFIYKDLQIYLSTDDRHYSQTERLTRVYGVGDHAVSFRRNVSLVNHHDILDHAVRLALGLREADISTLFLDEQSTLPPQIGIGVLIVSSRYLNETHID